MQTPTSPDSTPQHADDAEQLLSALAAYLQGQAPPPAADILRELTERYSFFAAPVAALLRAYGAELTDTERTSLQARLALLSGSSATAIDMVEQPRDDFYPAPTPTPVPTNPTDAALDTFFATYGHTSPEEEALLERLIFNPVPDYSEVLAREEASAEALPPIRKAPTRKPAVKTADESPLSLSLAKIFIRQGRYERAYEIINGLNLNYPEKNAYFADQLRFLRRLIDLQRRSKAATEGAEAAD